MSRYLVSFGAVLLFSGVAWADAKRPERVAGHVEVVPDHTVQAAVARAQIPQLDARLRVCIDVGGRVTNAEILSSSGFDSYDSSLLEAVRGWRYTPFQVDGDSHPFCDTVDFRYTQEG